MVESVLHAASTLKSTGEIRTRPPNILVILADDLGIDALAQYQSYMIANAGFPSPAVRYPNTPTLQSMRTAGVRFFNMHVMPNCSPTRACILSGRYPFRHGIGSVVREANMDLTRAAWEFGINHATDEMVIHRLPVPKGYRCGIFGKWHLAAPDGGTVPDGIPWSGTQADELGTGWSHPDAILGTDGANVDYGLTFSNLDINPLPPTSGGNLPGYYNFYWRERMGGEAATTTQVAGTHHSAYTRQKLQDWIADQRTPWMAYWALCAIHSPFGDFPNNGGGNSGCMPPDDGTTASARSTYYPLGSFPVHNSVQAALEHMDYQIGLLKAAMGAEWDRTMVFFIGDNGTQANVIQDMAAYQTSIGNPIGAPYSTLLADAANAFKGNVHEAGIRVPMIVCGPLVRNPNRDYLGLVDGVDVYQTVREIARVPLSAKVSDDRYIDSISFMHVLQDGTLNVAGSRQFSFSEIFSPLGDPANATDTALGHVRDRAYTMRIAGDGVYAVKRKRVGTSNVDTFFKLGSDVYAPVDPFQQNPLATGSGVPNYVACTQALNDLLQTQTVSIG